MDRSTERLRSEIPEPPQDLVDVIGGGLEIGRGHLAQLRALAALRPHEHVLDVGCGVGRTAIALSSYLSRQGAYEGFDIWPEAIEWCQREITPRLACSAICKRSCKKKFWEMRPSPVRMTTR